MYRICRIGLAAAIIAVAASGTAEAAARPAKRPARAPVPQASPTEVLVSHLFLNRYQSGENLAAACRRANFKNLAIALNLNRELLSSPKGEFETTTEYEKRAGELASVLAGEPVVICEPLDDNPDISFTYQADAQRFDGSFSKGHNVWRDIKQLGTYRSRTRMGIPTTIKASLEMEYDVSLDLASGLKGCLKGDYYSYKFRTPATLAAAPALKARGQLVFLARLTAPYIEKSERRGNPTLDDPYDTYNQTLTVRAKPEKLIVIDAAGTEAWSCKIGAYDPLQPPTPIGDPASWLSALDNPTRFNRNQPPGTVAATLGVGADGQVTDCVVTSSSGFPDMDRAACDGWRRRAKFEPASDKDGAPTVGTYAVSITWKSYGL